MRTADMFKWKRFWTAESHQDHTRAHWPQHATARASWENTHAKVCRHSTAWPAKSLLCNEDRLTFENTLRENKEKNYYHLICIFYNRVHCVWSDFILYFIDCICDYFYPLQSQQHQLSLFTSLSNLLYLFFFCFSGHMLTGCSGDNDQTSQVP